MFDTLPYWLGIVVVAALIQLLPPTAVRVRALALAVASAAVIGLVLRLTSIDWLILGVGLGWYCVVLPRIAGRKQFALALVPCAPLLLDWMIGKSLTITGDARGSILLFVGYSFLLIKAFTLAKDVSDGRRQPPDPALILAYLLFFPTFLAGPMHLFGEFEPQVTSPGSARPGGLNTVFRFVLGLFKVRVLAPLLKPMSLTALETHGTVSPAGLLLASIVYSFVILLDFSGYTDLAISTAAIAGFRTPENFAWPYLAANVRDFWQRWHITFSRVLTGYLFIPLTRALQPALGARRTLLAIVGYATTFLFCGFWHGSGVNFLVWGLYHAAGLIVVDAWRRSRGPARPQPVAKLGSASLIPPMAAWPGVAATFVFVSIGWIFFVLPLSRLMSVLR